MSAENDIVERLPRWKTGPVLREHPGYFLVPVADIDEAAAEIVRLRGELALAAGWHLESIAPAEAKGGACGCGEATCVEPWEPGCGLGTSIEHARVSPQPAGGEAVAWMTPGGDVSRSLLWCEERCLPGQKPTPLYTTPPAAQVQRISAGDAVFAFSALLTSLPHVVPFGSAAWATPGAKLAAAFNEANGLAVSCDFPSGLRYPKIEGELLEVIQEAAKPEAPHPAAGDKVREELDALRGFYAAWRADNATGPSQRRLAEARDRVEALAQPQEADRG